MTFFQIPARNDLPWYQFKITLSGVIYTLVFRYNTRMQRWILDIADPAGNQIITGLVLLIERLVTSQYVTLALPPGPLFALDDTNQDAQPTLFSFGIDHTLAYGDPTQ
jgi:hypothetical protein